MAKQKNPNMGNQSNTGDRSQHKDDSQKQSSTGVDQSSNQGGNRQQRDQNFDRSGTSESRPMSQEQGRGANVRRDDIERQDRSDRSDV